MTLRQWWLMVSSVDRLWIMADDHGNDHNLWQMKSGFHQMFEVLLYDVKPCLDCFCRDHPGKRATGKGIMENCIAYIANALPAFKEFGPNPFLTYRMARNRYVSSRAPLLSEVLKETLDYEEQRTDEDLGQHLINGQIIS